MKLSKNWLWNCCSPTNLMKSFINTKTWAYENFTNDTIRYGLMTLIIHAANQGQTSRSKAKFRKDWRKAQKKHDGEYFWLLESLRFCANKYILDALTYQTHNNPRLIERLSSFVLPIYILPIFFEPLLVVTVKNIGSNLSPRTFLLFNYSASFT